MTSNCQPVLLVHPEAEDLLHVEDDAEGDLLLGRGGDGDDDRLSLLHERRRDLAALGGGAQSAVGRVVLRHLVRAVRI